MPQYQPFNQPFAEQLEFFRRKLNLPTEAWDDIRRMAHDRAFIVAGAQGADLLEDLRGAVDEAIGRGTGLEAFRKNFKRIVAERGWTGWTGEGTKGGEAWRTKVIYQTNMATSYAAGRWKQLNDPALLKVLPYWQYRHNDSVITPRPLHVSWDGLTLPPDHPFWQTHFPPNGWGCQCRVTAVSKEKFMRAVAGGKGPANAPTGTEGIDKGFDYAPGANAARPLKDFIDQKLIRLDAPIGAAMWQELKPVVLKETAQAFASLVEKTLLEPKPPGTLMVVGALKPRWIDKAAEFDIRPITADISVHDPDIWHTFRRGKNSQISLEWYKSLPYHLLEAKAVILDMTHDTHAFLLIYDGAEKSTKLVVQINYKIKKVGLRNIVETGKLVDVTGIRAMIGHGYELVEGGL